MTTEQCKRIISMISELYPNSLQPPMGSTKDINMNMFSTMEHPSESTQGADGWQGSNKVHWRSTFTLDTKNQNTYASV